MFTETLYRNILVALSITMQFSQKVNKDTGKFTQCNVSDLFILMKSYNIQGK